MDCSTFAFDLHVLGTPPALILSQDQTLKLKWSASAYGSRRTLQQDCLTQAPVENGSRIQILTSAPYDASARPFKFVCRPNRLRNCFGQTLILDGLCLHVLSSFQRTGLRCVTRQEFHSPWNLTNLPPLQRSVNQFFKSLRLFCSCRSKF